MREFSYRTICKTKHNCFERLTALFTVKAKLLQISAVLSEGLGLYTSLLKGGGF